MIRSYAIAGLGARGEVFRGTTWPVPPVGEIVWVRWHDTDWDKGLERPTTERVIGPDDPIEPEPPEFSEEWYDLCRDAGRFIIQIQEHGPWADRDEAAEAICDALSGFVSMVLPLGVEFSAVEIDPKWVNRGRVVIQEVEARDSQYWTPIDRHAQLRQGAGLGEQTVKQFLHCLPPVVAGGPSDGPFPALLYYRLSALEFGFAPDDRRQIINDPTARPEGPYKRARAEESYLNAWKAIEAILGGEPPKNERGLRQRLRKRGIDPNADPRFPDGKDDDLAQRVRRLHEVWPRSAHGGKQAARHLTYLDLVEVQWIAAELVEMGRTASRADSA